ncbi:monothiol glutaredoxin-S7, chloroplastic-like [Zingiber officinale]|uniref:monothiol glutaredoxin-S7, chloroplastic-like n=1 Tax=Zingiber officinale TaxID=94328 RepID=UPI001C4C2459|nr:monothiol glutaredoxin-S7, chloroplastic-like [Zingiber officinale]
MASLTAAAVASAAVFPPTPPNSFLGSLPFQSSYAVTSSLSVTRRLPHNRSDFTLIAQRRWMRPKAPGPSLSVRCSSALSPELKSTIDKVVQSQKVVLFMKGTKEFPQCGFSDTVVQVLNSLNVPFEALNILENEVLRQGMKEYSNWPTFPQLYIDGEFFGGCEIVVESYKVGQLQEVLEKALQS